MNSRILALAKKELKQLLRDRGTLGLIFLLPIIQLLIFGYVVAADIKNIKFGVLDQDGSSISRQLVAKIENSGYFINRGVMADYLQLEQALDSGKIKIGLVFPARFKHDLLAKKQPSLQVLIDGSDSNTASIARGYFLNIINSFSRQLMREHLRKMGQNSGIGEIIDFRYRIYYNPELKSVNYMIPGIMVLVLLLITTMLTALSVVKEKELGTIEQIMVTPLKQWEFIVGKILPFPVIGMMDVLLVITVIQFWFRVPLHGSIWLLLFCAVLFLMTTLGMGLLVSTVSKTQQQAMLTAVFFFIPNMMLSGFIFPISNMPKFFQFVSLLIPGRYFIEIVRGIYLKGLGIRHLYPQMLALIVMGIFILWFAVKNVKKQLT
jgi:ABC-2 type transport system permease protein